MAPKVGETGKVLAVDVQDEMLQTLKQRAAAKKIANVQVIKASETDPHLPADAVDLVLVVDVYHELPYPYEVMQRVRDSLKPDGHVAFVEYRKEDPAVPIKGVHKMSVAQRGEGWVWEESEKEPKIMTVSARAGARNRMVVSIRRGAVLGHGWRITEENAT